MWLIKLAWKNIWRNRNRTLISMSAIFFAVIFSVVANSLWKGTFGALIQNLVGYYSGYIQIQQAGYWDEQVLDNSLEWSDSLKAEISGENNIDALSPRLESFALMSSGDITKGCLVVGIDPMRESEVTQLQERLKKGRYLESGDQAILLTEGLAEQLQLSLEDTVYIIGQGFHGATAAGKYPIKGILKYGAPDLNNRLAFLSLPAAQELYGAENRATSVVISLHDQNLLEETVLGLKKRLDSGLVAMTWKDMMPEIVQHMKTDHFTMQIIQYLLYLLIAFGIFGTLTMMMVERQFEMGMLIALGMKKGNMILLMVIESVFTVITGCLAGLAASIPVAFYFKNNPIRFGGEFGKAYERFGFEAVMPGSTEPGIFWSQGLIVLCLGLLLSLYPLYKILRMDPVKAMRR
ncbi:MAG TPA: FtsX-like permease family protein [Saprospiraceae bacterium]|nr:FtsX-like permease family protein [Saprospiraceae bacterium]HNT20622.1 FtsX-like permease family protein [Saprospiraceae bacterium]